MTVEQTEDVEQEQAPAALVDAATAPESGETSVDAEGAQASAAAEIDAPAAEDGAATADVTAAASEPVVAGETASSDGAAAPEDAAPAVAASSPLDDTAPAVDESTTLDDAAPAVDESTTLDDAEAAAGVAVDELADAPAAEVDDIDDAPAAEDTSAEEPEPLLEAAAQPAPAPAPVPVDRPEPTTMEELLAEQSTEIRSLKHGDVVEGTVVRIDKDEILVDIGAKSEGVVSNRELYGRNAESQPQLNMGDTVLVYVLQPESNEGHAVLSLRRAGLERKWRAMQEQLDAGVIIEAPVIDHNKGGLIVDCGIRGFVPISQIVDFPRRPQNEQPRDAAQEIAEKLQPYVGRKLRLKILEVNRKANRLILSEKVALYEERREKRDELFSSLKVGQQVKGTVRSIAPFGVFVDLGGIDGLVHKSELSWNKVNNPEAGYRVGEEVEAEVIDINHERGRISLSIRRLQPDPWHSTVADLKVGDVIEGTVTKIVNFGAFVRVREGLEGLIHISELSQQRVAHPGDVVHEGQKLNLKVISLDSERHRLGLSLKQAEEAPARPAPEPGAPSQPRERSDRRGGRDRGGYDASQAVQEPEGGIDNTLAAAFALVREQMAQQEAAEAGSGTSDEVEAPAAQAQAPAAESSAPEAEPATAEAEPTTAEAEPATAEAEPTTAEAEPATAEAEPVTAEAAAPEVEAEPVTAEAAAPEAEPEPTTAEAAAPEADAEPTTAEAAETESAEPEAQPVTAATEQTETDETTPAATGIDPETPEEADAEASAEAIATLAAEAGDDAVEETPGDAEAADEDLETPG